MHKSWKPKESCDKRGKFLVDTGTIARWVGGWSFLYHSSFQPFSHLYNAMSRRLQFLQWLSLKTQTTKSTLKMPQVPQCLCLYSLFDIGNFQIRLHHILQCTHCRLLTSPWVSAWLGRASTSRYCSPERDPGIFPSFFLKNVNQRASILLSSRRPVDLQEESNRDLLAADRQQCCYEHLPCGLIQGCQKPALINGFQIILQVS